MKEYYFYLKPDIFLWKGIDNILMYNARLGKGVLSERNYPLDNVVDQLIDINNMYCISLSEREFKEECIVKFIISTQESKSGGIVNKSGYPYNKPVILKPELSLQESIESRAKYSEFYVEDKNMNHLLECTIHLSGSTNSSDYYKQLTYPVPRYSALSFQDLDILLEQISYSRCKRINILGSQFHKLYFFKIFLDRLDRINAAKVFYYRLDDFPFGDAELSFIKTEQFSATLIIEPDTSNELFDTARSQLQNFKDYFEVQFITTSDEDIERANVIIEKYRLNNVQMLPYYSGMNLDFFRKNVFISEDDLLHVGLNRRQIFANQILNTWDFGRISVFPDGTVYANVNNPAIGRIEDGLLKLIGQEFENGESWFKTRDKVNPCKDCVFRYLCPPVSNYEYLMGRYNLCHVCVPPKKKTIEALV